jgi:hypothetical protein
LPEKDLERWIVDNFKYKHKGKEMNFKKSYVHKIISGGKNPCKSHIIRIDYSNGGFIISPVGRIAK